MITLKTAWTVLNARIYTLIDGTEAATFGLTGDIRIGRDRNSDIRLKIPSVSRNHARVYQDENGNVSFLLDDIMHSTFLTGQHPHFAITRFYSFM